MTKFGTVLAGGTPPDIVAVDLVYAPQFAAANPLSDITDLARSLPSFAKRESITRSSRCPQAGHFIARETALRGPPPGRAP